MPVFIHEANRAVGKRFAWPNVPPGFTYEGMQLEGISPEVIHNVGYPLRQELLDSAKGLAQLGVAQETVSSLFSEAVRECLLTWVKQNIGELARKESRLIA